MSNSIKLNKMEKTKQVSAFSQNAGSLSEKHNKYTLDLSEYMADWEGFSQYNCPVLVVPGHFVSAVREGIVNDHMTARAVKINGLWIPVHSVNNGRVGTYRVPNRYPNTCVSRVMTTAEMSKLLSSIAEEALANFSAYAEKLKQWLQEDSNNSDYLLSVMCGGACWRWNDPKGYFSEDNWAVILSMTGAKFDITNLNFEERYIKL